jgi:outer membrane protein TolC
LAVIGVERNLRTMKCGPSLPALAFALLAALPAAAQDTRLPPNSPYLGSVTKDSATTGPRNLSVKEAVQLALQNNLGLLLQEESEATAQGARWRALAELLPNVSGSLHESRQVINLEAYGFQAKPSIIGPFNLFDARVAVSQAVVDVRALNDSNAAALKARAQKYGVTTARDLVVLVAVNLYLETVATGSRVEATRAQFETADALLRQAQDLKNAGVVAGIDVLRAQVQAQTQRQRVIAAENDYEKAKLQLARAIGLPAGQPLTLTDKIPYAPMAVPPLDQLLPKAFDARSDYLAAKTRLEAAQASRKAADGMLYPSLHVDADYGAIGQTFNAAHSTYTVAANVHVPIFEGGRATARRLEAASELRQREAELADLRGRVEFEVRSALLDLRAAELQVQAAQTNVQLATETLTQARDRFAAGVAGNLEVTQAQESVAASSETYIAALYSHNLAKAALARALGIAESAVTAYVGGNN